MEAIEHAGIPTQRLSGTATGTLFGIYQKDYMLRVHRPLEETNAYAMYTDFDSISPVNYACRRRPSQQQRLRTAPFSCDRRRHVQTGGAWLGATRSIRCLTNGKFLTGVVKMDAY